MKSKKRTKETYSKPEEGIKKVLVKETKDDKYPIVSLSRHFLFVLLSLKVLLSYRLSDCHYNIQ